MPLDQKIRCRRESLSNQAEMHRSAAFYILHLASCILHPTFYILHSTFYIPMRCPCAAHANARWSHGDLMTNVYESAIWTIWIQWTNSDR